jgi:putative membrane protein
LRSAEAPHEASTQPGSQLDKHLMDLLVKAQKQDEDSFDDERRCLRLH